MLEWALKSIPGRRTAPAPSRPREVLVPALLGATEVPYHPGGRSDGTEAGTNTFSSIYNPSDLVVSGPYLYFLAENQWPNITLWRTDGHSSTTKPIKSGLYHLARAFPQVRLVPVWIENLKRVLPKGTLVPIPLACSVRYGTPLRLADGEDKAAFIARARASMLDLRPEYDKAEDPAP